MDKTFVSFLYEGLELKNDKILMRVSYIGEEEMHVERKMSSFYGALWHCSLSSTQE